MEHEIEIWKTAQYIFEDGHKEVFEKYQVSSLGRVKSLNYHNTGKEGILNQSTITSKDGSIFYMVGIRKDKKTYQLTVHRLVLSSFKESEFFEGAVCDHIVARTATSCDNRSSNLHWVTYQQNNSTEHSKEMISKANAKRVKVTFSDGTQKVYYGGREIVDALGLCRDTVYICIKKYNGYYKKLDLHFEYL